MVKFLRCRVMVCAVVVFLVTDGFSAFEYKLLSAYSAGCGGAQAVSEPEPLSIFYMPCNLVLLNRFSIQTFYTRIFNMEELSVNAAAFGFPVLKSVCLAAGYSVFGKRELYQEQEIVLACGLRIKEISSLGLAVRFMSLEINEQDYINKIEYVPAFDISCGFKKNPVFISFLIKNINSAQIGRNYKENIGREIVLGVNLLINARVNMYMESFKEIPYDLSFRYGIDYKITDGLKLLFGMQARPAFIGAGFCVKLFKLRLDYSIRSHQYLSLQHLTSFSLYF
ncbi:MAG: hypothetical protein ABH857_03415 [Elusimicrobiota bacterium]